MALAFGLLTALGYGLGDFLAGLAARRVSSSTVVLYGQAIGAVAMMVAALALGGPPVLSSLLWGVLSGVALGIGFAIYFRALVAGATMGIVAAVTGVWSALVPFAVGLALGERPSWLALAGVALAAAAIGLASSGTKYGARAGRRWRREGRAGHAEKAQEHSAMMPRAIAEAIFAGVMFGLFFVFLDRAEAGSPLWPVASATLASALIVAVMVPLLRPTLRAPRAVLATIAAVGLCQAFATLTFVIAVREGLLSIVAVAGALSPVLTALFALLFLAERLSMRQSAGFLTALVGVALIALG